MTRATRGRRRRTGDAVVGRMLAVFAAVGGLAAPIAAAPAPEAHPLTAFAGPTWSVRDAELANGERLDADLRFTPLFGGTAVHEQLRMRLRYRDTELAFTYETLHAAPGGDGAFDSVTVGSDATILERRSRMVDGGLVSETVRRSDGGRLGRRGLELRDGELRWRIQEDRGPEVAARVVLEAVLRRPAAESPPLPPLPPPAATVDGPAAILAPLAGSWRTEARWSSGQSLEGRQEMRLDPGGGFLWVDTFARDGGGPEYHRYAGFHARDPELGWRAFAVDMTGRLASVAMEVREGEAGPEVVSRSTMDGPAGPVDLDQLTRIVAPDRMQWIVRSRPVAAGDDPAAWTPLMDAVWTRTAPVG